MHKLYDHYLRETHLFNEGHVVWLDFLNIDPDLALAV